MSDFILEQEAELLQVMGSDLVVVNAARVSHADLSTEISDGDVKLLKYLVSHKHWTPFAHCFATFRMYTPFYVRTQLYRSYVAMPANEAMGWNEVSRRYVQKEPKFFLTPMYYADVNVKQGSKNTINTQAMEVYKQACLRAKEEYAVLLRMQVAPESARAVLPESTMTEWYWSGPLAAWLRVMELRYIETTGAVQKETRRAVANIAKAIQERFPETYAVWEEAMNFNKFSNDMREAYTKHIVESSVRDLVANSTVLQ